MTMTDKEIEELEQLDPGERAKRLSHQDTFALSKQHMDIITHDLFPDDDASNIKLARIIRDLVSTCVDGTTDLLDNRDESDSADRTARRLLFEDHMQYTNHWLLKSIHTAQNRQGKTKASQVEPEDGQDDQDHPSLNEIKDYARLKCLGGVPGDMIEQVSRNWYDSMTKNHWLDDRGDPIKRWRSVFERYCQKAWLKQATDTAINKG